MRASLHGLGCSAPRPGGSSHGPSYGPSQRVRKAAAGDPDRARRLVGRCSRSSLGKRPVQRFCTAEVAVGAMLLLDGPHATTVSYLLLPFECRLTRPRVPGSSRPSSPRAGRLWARPRGSASGRVWRSGISRICGLGQASLPSSWSVACGPRAGWWWRAWSPRPSRRRRRCARPGDVGLTARRSCGRQAPRTSAAGRPRHPVARQQ
jgi:hypothetical protein